MRHGEGLRRLADNAGSLKFIRLILVITLAVLLPIRGVVAATAACPDGPHGAAPAQAAQGPGHHLSADVQAAEHGQASASHADQAKPTSNEVGSGGHSGSAACCAAFLVAEMPTLVAPPAHAAVRFPRLSAPAPDFHSGRQERPPRSI